MIFGVGTNSTSNLPGRVGILLTDLISASLPDSLGEKIFPNAKSLTAAAWKIASTFLAETAFIFWRRSAVVVKVSTRCARRSPAYVADSPTSRITVWPRAARKLAKSVPKRPVEKFVSRRTSSSGSKVGPAVTMQFMWRG